MLINKYDHVQIIYKELTWNIYKLPNEIKLTWGWNE